MDGSNPTEIGLIAVGDESAVAGLSLRKREIKIAGGKKEEFDFQGEVERMLDSAKHRRASNSGIKIDEVGFGSGILNALNLVDPVERLLREAQDHVRAERYEEALTALSELLRLKAGDREAIYLTAYCQANRDDREEAATLALHTLRPLRDAELEQELAIRVAGLREAIRSRRFPTLWSQITVQGNERVHLIRLLRQEVELDPGFAVLHYALAGELLARGSVDEAIAAVDTGCRFVPEDERAPLKNIRDSAVGVKTARALEPARDAYRQGKFSHAYGALTKVDVPRDSRLFVTFEAYLRELSAGAKGFWSGLLTVGKTRTPAEVRPLGDSGALDELGFFLVRPDLDSVRRFQAPESSLNVAEDAERCALEGTRQAPWFPFIHFICGECIHARLNAAMATADGPSLESIESDLRSARSHYELAGTDPEIEGVENAIDWTDELLRQVQEAKKMRAERREEQRQLNAAIEEFNATVRFAGDGIRNPEHYRRLRERFDALKGRLPTLRNAVKTDQGREVLTQLTEAVQLNLKNLDKLRPEIEDDEKVEKVFIAFKTKMDYLGANPISTAYELDETKRFLNQLLKTAASARATLRTDHGRKNLDQLTTQVRTVVGLLNRH